MKQIPLNATVRSETGKGPNRRLRAEGQIPAVVYGAGNEPKSLSVPTNELEKVLRHVSGGTAFLALAVNGAEPITALMKDIQTDYLGRDLVHVDFYEVRADQELTLDVSLEFVGTAKGTDQGGVVNVANYSITVKGLIKDIPDFLEVDVADLDLDEAIHARELTLPAGVALESDADMMLASCSVPMAAEEGEAEDEEGEEGAEAAEGGAEDKEASDS